MLEVFLYFLKLGCLGFGGPLAVVAAMQEELVDQRKWISPEKFQQSYALIKSMPGPVAFSMAVFLGRIRAGFGGAFLAGFGIVLPSFLLMLGFGYFLSQIPDSPPLTHALMGMQIAALAVVTLSLSSLAKGFEKLPTFWLLAFAALVICWRFPRYEPLIILISGMSLVFWTRRLITPRRLSVFLIFVVASAQASQIYQELFEVCFKAGAFVFGSGLAIVPMLEADVVQHHSWMTQSEFLNALALGQVTPGPVVITATYIGYKVAGIFGALVATGSIFLASFVHMSTWFPKAVDTLARQSWIRAFTTGAVAAVVGCIASVVIRLCSGFSWSPILAAFFVGSLIVGYKKWLPAWVLIPIGALVALAI